MLKSIANEGQHCCSPTEVKVCSVFFRLLHFGRSRIYKSRMALDILLGFNLPPAQFLLKLTRSWWLQCIYQLAFLENNGQKMKLQKTSLRNKQPCFHTKCLHPSQLQEQTETNLEMCCAVPSGNWNTVNDPEIENWLWRDVQTDDASETGRAIWLWFLHCLTKLFLHNVCGCFVIGCYRTVKLSFHSFFRHPVATSARCTWSLPEE